jgi:hypothetical protein
MNGATDFGYSFWYVIVTFIGASLKVFGLYVVLWWLPVNVGANLDYLIQLRRDKKRGRQRRPTFGAPEHSRITAGRS